MDVRGGLSWHLRWMCGFMWSFYISRSYSFLFLAGHSGGGWVDQQCLRVDRVFITS